MLRFVVPFTSVFCQLLPKEIIAIIIRYFWVELQFFGIGWNNRGELGLGHGNKVNSFEQLLHFSKLCSHCIDCNNIYYGYQMHILMNDLGEVYLNRNDYDAAYKLYLENRVLYPDYAYIYEAKINVLISYLIEKANLDILKKDYISAYKTMKFISSIYPNINKYIEDNIAMLKLELESQNADRINNYILDIINDAKNQFKTLDQSTVIQIGNSFNKIVKLIGEPIEIKSRRIVEDTYQMSTYIINNINYRLFFENNILFDIEKYD